MSEPPLPVLALQPTVTVVPLTVSVTGAGRSGAVAGVDVTVAAVDEPAALIAFAVTEYSMCRRSEKVTVVVAASTVVQFVSVTHTR